jgi:tetratricopeptide (TPR) repeat protein
MTRLSPLVVLAFASVSFPAGASVVTVGGSYAVSCYEAAESQTANFQSLDACDRAIAEEALMPRDRAATHVNRGILYLRRGSLAEADADFNRALAINPYEPEAWLNKAILNARHRKSTDALPLVAKALENGTRRPAIAYFVRAMAYEDSGRIADAYRDLQLARKLDPKWAEPAIELRRFQVRRP